VEQLARSACAKGARVIVEKPFGRDLASARDLNRILLGTFVEADIFRIDHYLGKRPVHNMLFVRFSNLVLQAFWNRTLSSAPLALEAWREDGHKRPLKEYLHDMFAGLKTEI
jgi:glucose-6-phosphate 1-dehydrogenase